MVLQRKLTLPNDINAVSQLNEFIDMLCEELGIDMPTNMALNLALEEAVVNVMSYAYPEGTKGEVGVEAAADDDRIVFVITDSGKPFDPTKKDEVDTTLPLEERSIGGLGIHLIRQIMDEVKYQRRENQNILTLSKTIKSL